MEEVMLSVMLIVENKCSPDGKQYKLRLECQENETIWHGLETPPGGIKKMKVTMKRIGD
jgi:hypothetical protein